MNDPIYEVVAWAEKQYPLSWQRDALRRVVEQSSIAKADHDELVAFVEMTAKTRVHAELPVEQFLVKPDAAKSDAAEPASASAEIPSNQPAKLGRMYSLKHVNALAQNQAMTFGLQGLTLVYGENGTGKTGYSRVLRRACRPWREKDIKPILANVARGASAGTPEAVFDIQVDGKVQAVSWKQGVQSPGELAHFAVFDSSCVRPILGEENSVAYQPEALKILPGLADVLRAVSGLIQIKIEKLKTLPLPPSPPLVQGTPSAIYWDRLASGATLAELDALIGDIVSVNNRHQAVTESLALIASKDGPEAQAGNLDLACRRVGGVRDQVAGLVAKFSDTAVKNLAEAEADRKNKQAAAELASKQKFDDAFLPGTGGGEVWRALYDAARQFSVQAAYPSEVFPFTGKEAQCVLCQQKLDSGGAERLKQFHAFVEDQTAKSNEEAKSNRDLLWKPMQEELVDFAQDIRDEIRGRDGGLGKVLDTIVPALRQRQTSIATAVQSGDWSAVYPMPADDLVAALNQAIASMQAEAAAKRNLADPEKKKQLEAEKLQLAGRISLHQAKPRVEEYFRQREIAKGLEKALGNCDTTALSLQNKKFNEKFITKAFEDHINAELRGLNAASRIKVEIRSRVERGENLNALVLADTTTAVKQVPDVLSEGEQRVLAIAAFIAELHLSMTPVGVIFDDPVSSLDHHWADRIAERLVDLAKDRQVIVFTHNASFSYMLRRHAERKQDAALHEQYVRRERKVPGHCSSDPTWEFTSLKGRRKILDDTLASVKTAHDSDPDGQEFRTHVSTLVGRLRSSWERLIEEVLLNGTINRFEPDIQTNRLREVEVTDGDFKTIYEAMSGLSGYTQAHDKSDNHMVRQASPEDLQKEITALYEFAGTFKKRREELNSKRKPLVEKAPKAEILPASAPSPGS